MANSIQPAIKNKPPIGVIGPKTESHPAWNNCRVHKRYKDPENKIMPIKKQLNAHVKCLL